MLNAKIVLFQRTKELNAKITEFLNNISEAAIIFHQAIMNYMQAGDNDDFEAKLNNVSALEARNDQLRRTIETKLYEHTLIPESRADVLELMEGLDKIVNMFEARLYQFSIEKIDINENLKTLYEELSESSVNAVEALVRSTRAFFVNISQVNDHIHKVMFFEKQGDMIGTKLKRQIFDNPDIESEDELTAILDEILGQEAWRNMVDLRILKKQCPDIIKMRKELNERIIEVQLKQLEADIRDCKRILESGNFGDDDYLRFESLKKERDALINESDGF